MKSKNLIIVGSVILVVILISAALALNSSLSSANNTSQLNEMTLSVLIPCQGHASLIIGELKKAGASEVSFELPNLFVVKYDTSKVDKEKILSLDVFKTYKATVIK